MKIHSHHDSDGVSSVALYILANDESPDEVYFPDIFGDFEEDTKVMIDMYPNRNEFTGLVIDHHPDIYGKDRKFKLIHSDLKPASLLVYEVFKNKIPKEKSWYVAVGLAGDAADALIPIEIHQRFPVLRRSISTSFRDNVRELPLWKYLSSVINSYCRFGRAEDALHLLLNCDSPHDLLEDEEGADLRMLIRKAVWAVEKNFRMIEIADSVLLGDFYHDYRIGGIIASEWHAKTQKTVIVINRRDWSFNIRGPLTNYVMFHMKRKFGDEISVGGHPEAAGGRMNRRIWKELINSGLEV